MSAHKTSGKFTKRPITYRAGLILDNEGPIETRRLARMLRVTISQLNSALAGFYEGAFSNPKIDVERYSDGSVLSVSWDCLDLGYWRVGK